MSYFNDKTDKDLSVPGHGQGMPGTDARRRSYELNEKYAGKDNTPSEDNTPQEDYSLSDDRRVKVLSPGTLVAKRFFRNRLAVVGLTILAVMFIFSFIGGLVSPYGQDEVFYRDDIQMKEYAALSENTEYRYLIADGQEFGAILQAQLTLHMGKDDSFSYKGVNYDITEEGDSLYSVSSGGTLLAVAYKDIVNPSVTGEKFSFSFSFNALKAHVTGETEFTADGKTYTMDDGSVMLNGEEVAYISRYVIQSKVSGTVISKEFKERVIEAAGKGETQIEYTNENGEVREIQLEYNPAKYQWSIKEGTVTRVFDAYSFPNKTHPLAGRNVQVYILQDRRGAVAIITKSQVLHRQDRLGICHNIVPFFTKVVRPAQTPARRGKRRSRKPLLPKTANRRVFSALAEKILQSPAAACSRTPAGRGRCCAVAAAPAVSPTPGTGCPFARVRAAYRRWQCGYPPAKAAQCNGISVKLWW